jgi:hypothetical protein
MSVGIGRSRTGVGEKKKWMLTFRFIVLKSCSHGDVTHLRVAPEVVRG